MLPVSENPLPIYGQIFRKEHSETLFPAFLETKYQFPRQGWSKIFNENGQMVGDGAGEWRQQNF